MSESHGWLLVLFSTVNDAIGLIPSKYRASITDADTNTTNL